MNADTIPINYVLTLVFVLFFVPGPSPDRIDTPTAYTTMSSNWVAPMTKLVALTYSKADAGEPNARQKRV